MINIIQTLKWVDVEIMKGVEVKGDASKHQLKIKVLQKHVFSVYITVSCLQFSERC